MTLTAADVYRDFETDGVPGSGNHKPAKPEIRSLLGFYETLLNSFSSGLAFTTLAALQADLAHAANTLAIVYGDGTPGNNGQYQKVGASGTGSWTRIGDLPNSIVRLTDLGTGTANAIVATAQETPIQPGNKLYLLTPTFTNTGATTISINGATPATIKNAFGADLVANSLLAGTQVLMAVSGSNYQLLISASVDASAILASAQAAAAAAQAAAASVSVVSSATGFPIYNGKIVEFHSGGAVTYAIKTAAGGDPSAINPAYISFVQQDGSFVERAVTAATSVTISSGSTLGQNNGSAFQVAIVAIDNAGTVELAAGARLTTTSAAGSGINCLYLNETLLYSTTAEGGAGGADSVGGLYSTTTRSNKSIAVLARADYDSGLATAGTWNASPSRILLMKSGHGAGIPASFFGHRNNVSQTGALHLAYTKVMFTTLRFSSGNFFDGTLSRWIPPAGLVELSAAVWWQANFAQTGYQSLPNASADAVAKIIRNGTVDIAAGEGHAPAGFPDTAGAFIPNCRDLANGTDYYELWAYSTSKNAANDVVIDGNPAHTWFCGSVIGGG